MLNSPTHIKDEIRDSIGLGMSKKKLVFFNVGHFDIMGVVCSNNNVDGWGRP